jgi:hypothetical protein
MQKYTARQGLILDEFLEQGKRGLKFFFLMR